MIKLTNVNKYFNRHKKNQIHVINNVSLELGDNGLVALLGPSGSGKTTLLNAIGGLDKVNKGKIFVNGKKISTSFVNQRDKIRNLNIGYIFQDYKLIDHMSVFDNVALVLKMVGIKDKKEIATRVNYVLETLDMYRYRYRPASMLSGGERQRVGIARAIVKDPHIIIADEPTGNLDSKNSLEIMNIIKSISKERLVILVTHERELAKFYASRIIELKDGTIINDYENEAQEELDYLLDNKIYLKDFENQEQWQKDDIDINYYSDGGEKLHIDIVVRNGNIYIRSNNSSKLEVIDDNSSLELVDDHYKKIDKSIYQKYEFNFHKVINKDIKKKYKSIFNPITLLINGFKKVFSYPALKKLLLIGFFASGIFIMYAVSNISAALNIEDKDFVRINKNYLTVDMGKIVPADYIKYETLPGVSYMMPSDSSVSFNVAYNDYYQSSKAADTLSGSLASVEIISPEDIVYGRMPENEYEIVVDKLALTKMFEDTRLAQQIGISEPSGMLNRPATIPNMKEFTIVGITDLEDPSIYAYATSFVNILSNKGGGESGKYDSSSGDQQSSGGTLFDYKLYEDKVALNKGRWPENDYEVVVSYDNRDTMPLNKQIATKVNGEKLKVVGYYTSEYGYDYYLTTNNTIKISLIENSSNLTIYPSDKEAAFESFRQLGLNITDSYLKSKSDYVSAQREEITSALIIGGIILAISLVEIFFMTRSSFLSRIKEIGIYRAIGVKKSDIYKMFYGEIVAITTLTSLPGILFMAYIAKTLSSISYLSRIFYVTTANIILAVVFVYLFNIIVGLIPVHNTMRKTPAQILSRHDLD